MSSSLLQKYVRPIWQSCLLGMCLLLLSLPLGQNAWAVVQAKVTNLSYERCPASVGRNMVFGSGVMPANCYLIHGTAVNATNKTIYNADVFGRVYDANGNDVMPERGRLGSVDESPPGKTDFEIMLSVPFEQAEPLTLKQFKVSGFAGKVNR